VGTVRQVPGTNADEKRTVVLVGSQKHPSQHYWAIAKVLLGIIGPTVGP